MENKAVTSSTQNSRLISASPEVIYKAITDPDALAVWLAPGEMTGKVHHFDLRTGGGYEMSLFYPAKEKTNRGKTNAKEDRFTARFVELLPFEKIREAVTFDWDDPAFSGEMMMEITLEAKGKATNVTFTFTNIPPGIRPEDNEAGTKMSLEKLARFAEQK